MSDHRLDAGNSPRLGPRVGILGAGRTRQGLGPFLAQWLERSGACVAGIAGRDRSRADAVSVSLALQLGHPVAAFEGPIELAQEVDGLVVACPVDGHLAGLDAALRAGVACLCEKPLVAASDLGEALERVQAFRDAGLLLVENCQWPFTLSAWRELYPEEAPQPVRSLAMRLSPASPGRAMVEDSLSHVISMLQALVPLTAAAEIRSVVQSDAGARAERNLVRFEIADGNGTVAVELHLQCCPQQPRPAWYAVNGRRLERRIGANYEISFAADDGRVVNVQDPLGLLVYGFVANLKRTQLERPHDLDAIELRLRLYAGILSCL
jgi:hypothetical protein